MDKKDTRANEKSHQPKKPQEEDEETNVEATSETSTEPHEQGEDQRKESAGAPTMSTVLEDNLFVDEEIARVELADSRAEDKETLTDGTEPAKDGRLEYWSGSCGKLWYTTASKTLTRSTTSEEDSRA